ncbi:MAG: helix-turn-helix transcriptional regulator [Desulfobacteraceae bacterium]|nr:helix-turn-helix transcriptional regulator [Desulfobacteraceae bacterium]
MCQVDILNKFMLYTDIIKRLRTIANLNQGDIASEIGKAQSGYSRKEAGQSPMSADEFFQIIEFLKSRVPKTEFESALNELFGCELSSAAIEKNDSSDKSEVLILLKMLKAKDEKIDNLQAKIESLLKSK